MSRPTRERVLDELRRCAAEQGTTPGKRLFEELTGITERDWYGRYWVRWNDVVKEAGLSSNSFAPQKFTDADLIAALAALARQLGHFPTNAEIAFHKQTSPDFPVESVFRKRLGTRRLLLEQVAAFADTEDDPALRALCEADRLWQQSEPEDASVLIGDAATGFVYLARSGKHFKIGYSNSLGRREYELAIQLPERLELIHAIETDDPPGIERYWHERFADRRANGEWFALTRADVASFKRRRRFM